MACKSVWSRSVITEPTTRPDQTAGVLLTTSIRGPTRWISSVTVPSPSTLSNSPAYGR